ncbi:similar to Saccharomyces cerevisiae YLR066W SPC3 Subunit of signal peptidase complex [Maudiozyma barnettii]|uniref:Signal peptidase subunit 3 n=1 Tax=Maudiozyma barnettii TaxID=61262 RepID=A0A8H2ZFM0_9SACH|nr:signal peptidase complex subunit SPC3 [Kazachstania barnettii]CAB4252484.1 similar to Saccharomyces cerevisiae YLR066W SPC3 Subunit of signal peptidase complex [Kazachstania barnettii]CAD1779218.1 similar to Saccharomyces cerevisiae YLR066W SPC3 Subunit of signal peptidase complex [Kazachstania barnettii]
MFSLSQRVQYIANFSMTVGLVIVALIIGSSHLDFFQKGILRNSQAAIANIKPIVGFRTSRFYGAANGHPKENTRIAFDLNTDLSGLFNWNTKQVFVYLTAEYNNTEKGTLNEVTFWDAILPDADHAIIKLENTRSKYSVWDYTGDLSGKDLQFKLHWNVQPHVGPLMYGVAQGDDIIVNVPKPESKV